MVCSGLHIILKKTRNNLCLVDQMCKIINFIIFNGGAVSKNNGVNTSTTRVTVHILKKTDSYVTTQLVFRR